MLPTAVPPTSNWRKSEGRKLLLKDVRAGRIHASMDWVEAFQYRPEFNVGVSYAEALRLFKDRLARIRKKVGTQKSRADEELRLLQQDRITHPAPAFNHRGEPRWEGSDVQKLLKQDVKNKVHETKMHTQFYLSRPEYQTLPKRILVAHIEQEVKLTKFKKQYRSRYGY